MNIVWPMTFALLIAAAMIYSFWLILLALPLAILFIIYEVKNSKGKHEEALGTVSDKAQLWENLDPGSVGRDRLLANFAFSGFPSELFTRLDPDKAMLDVLRDDVGVLSNDGICCIIQDLGKDEIKGKIFSGEFTLGEFVQCLR